MNQDFLLTDDNTMDWTSKQKDTTYDKALFLKITVDWRG